LELLQQYIWMVHDGDGDGDDDDDDDENQC
jgi:hypothetical protein